MTTFKIFNNEPDVRAFAAGESIFQEEQPADGIMYAVIEGEVEIRRQNKTLAVISVGGVFGEMALIDKKPRSANAIAKTDCRVAAINEKRFSALVMQNPYFALDLMKTLAERVRNSLES
jgi:CRP-like cAMP-binding protein